MKFGYKAKANFSGAGYFRYLCNVPHIKACCEKANKDISEDDIKSILDVAKEGIIDESKKKYYDHCVQQANRNREVDRGQVLLDATKQFEENPNKYLYGKSFFAQIHSLLHQKCGTVNLLVPTESLYDEQFHSILS